MKYFKAKNFMKIYITTCIAALCTPKEIRHAMTFIECLISLFTPF